MTALTIDTDALERDGFVVLRRIVPQEDIAQFENAIARFSESQLHKLSGPPQAVEPFIDVFSWGGAYTDRVYKLMERLWVLNRMTTRIAQEFERCGFLEWAGIEIPLVWPDIRADIPYAPKQNLSVHQDYRSMQCRRAWRVWVPLRPSNATLGSMKVFPGTHKYGVVEHQFDDPSRPVVDPQLYSEIEPVVMDLPAGDGVLLNPLCLHGSVQNRAQLTKFTLMVQIQDYASLIDPDDDQGEFAAFKRFLAGRTRSDAAGIRLL